MKTAVDRLASRAEAPLTNDVPRRLGRIVAVTGSHAVILLDNGEGLPGGGSARSPEIGTLLKVDTTPSIALALVSALSGRCRRAATAIRS